MRVLSLFDGMSCGQIALNRLGISPSTYYAAETDRHAVWVTQNNYPDTVQLGDINHWKTWAIDWSEIDLILGGSPCQGFSCSGKNRAFEDPRSQLFFTFVDILNHARKENPDLKFLMENVKMRKDHLDIISENLGVEPLFINSGKVSAQNRQRYYWFNWEASQPEDMGLILADVIEDNPENPTYMSHKFCTRNAHILREDFSGKARSLSSMEYVKNGRQGDYIKPPNAETYRKLTPLECERLQTIPEGYTGGVSNTQRYRMLGNGWTVEVIAHLLKHIPMAAQWGGDIRARSVA